MKKRKIRIKILPVAILVGILILFIIIISSCSKEEPIVEPKKTSFINEFSNSSGQIVDDRIKKTIIEFFDLYYLSMKELNEYNMMYLFEDNKESYLTQTAMSYLIEYRKNQRNDLKISDCSYNLDVKKVEIEDDKLVFTVYEDSFVNFNFMKDIKSESYNIKNTFTFQNDNDDYELVSYAKAADFYNVITDNYKDYETKEDKIVKDEMEAYKNSSISTVKEAVLTEKSYYENYLNNKMVSAKTCDNTYNRTSALNYALEWASKRNSEYAAFDSYGGNCQNYASQVLFAGGIPLDLEGNYKWKWFGSSVDETTAEKGRTPSWTGVDQFYSYARNNKGQGLCASVNINYFAAEEGDIMQVGSNDSWAHTIVIVGAIKENGKILDLLTTSNTTDRKNYPLSAYNCAGKRLIKIYGWNEE